MSPSLVRSVDWKEKLCTLVSAYLVRDDAVCGGVHGGPNWAMMFRVLYKCSTVVVLMNVLLYKRSTVMTLCVMYLWLKLGNVVQGWYCSTTSECPVCTAVVVLLDVFGFYHMCVL